MVKIIVVTFVAVVCFFVVVVVVVAVVPVRHVALIPRGMTRVSAP